VTAKISRIEVGKKYPNNWKDRILMFGFDEEEVKFYCQMAEKEIYVASCATDLIAFGARMVLIKDGPQWQEEKWQVKEYLEKFVDTESCCYCVVHIL